MKKHFFTFIVLIGLIMSIAVNAEVFKFSNGVEFGMSYEDVKKLAS